MRQTKIILLARFAAIAITLCAGQILFAQRVSFGFVGGTPLTRDFPIYRTFYTDPSVGDGLITYDWFSDTRSVLAGLSVNVDLGRNFSLEANAVHRNLHLETRTIYPEGSVYHDVFPTSTWEFPILARYRLPLRGALRPFVEGGPSFRIRRNPGATEPSRLGATAGAGIEFHSGHIRIAPALLYTRWQYDGGYPHAATKRDQIEFVTELSYATSVPAWHVGGRKLRFGLVGGTSLTDGISTLLPPERIDEAQDYIAGLALEVELNHRLSMEANGLYRPFRANQYTTGAPPGFPAMNYSFEFTVVTWQFPVLVKYSFQPAAKIHPVLEAGPSFRVAGNLNGFNPSHHGITAGGGIEMQYKAVKVSPVLRYTRWAKDTPGTVDSALTAANQVEVLVSFTF
jgi:hypothetical protein